MRATLTVKELHRALSVAARTIQASHIPVLAFARIAVTKSDGVAILTATATDLDVTISHRVVCAGGDEGEILIPAVALRRVLALTAPVTLVTLTAIDGRCRVDFPDARFSLMTLPVSDFPELGKDWSTAAPLALPASFVDGLDRLDHFISREEARYYLNGVCAHAQNGRIAMIATNGHQLGRQFVEADPAALGGARIIIPRRACDLVRALARRQDIAADVLPTHLRLAFGDTILTTKLIDGTYPAYEKVIPKEHPIIWTAPRGALISKLQRLAALTEERAGRPISLAWNGRTVTGAVNAEGAGHAVMAMPGTITGAKIGTLCAVQSRMLIEVLQSLPCPQVTLALSGERDPILATGEGGAIGVVMPCYCEVKAEALPEGIAA